MGLTVRHIRLLATHIAAKLCVVALLCVAICSLPALSAAAKPAPTSVRSIVFPPLAGKILATPTGRVLYVFSRDTRRATYCRRRCAQVWRPLLTTGRPVAAEGSGVHQHVLATIRLTSHKLQVTYDGHPLYTYSRDRPWQANGEHRKQFGATWHALNVAGAAPGPGNPCFAKAPACSY